MPKPKHIELAGDLIIPILYEDRSVLAVDKPAGWLLAPDSWDQTGRNLQLALQSSLSAGDFWARSRNLKYLRYIHRLDAETTGVLLLAKSPGALSAYGELFETRTVEKQYLAVVHGLPKTPEWTCTLPLMAEPGKKGRMKVATGAWLNPRPPANRGNLEPEADMDEEPRSTDNVVKDAETHFRVLQTAKDTALVEAHPLTGRTHQIRVHLSATGHPIVGDPVYGPAKAAESKGRQRVALRAVRLAFRDPFQKRMIYIAAPVADFAREYGFNPEVYPRKARNDAKTEN